MALGGRRRASFLGRPIAWLGAGWRDLVDVIRVDWMRARERLGVECRRAASPSLVRRAAVATAPPGMEAAEDQIQGNLAGTATQTQKRRHSRVDKA